MPRFVPPPCCLDPWGYRTGFQWLLKCVLKGKSSAITKWPKLPRVMHALHQMHNQNPEVRRRKGFCTISQWQASHACMQ